MDSVIKKQALAEKRLFNILGINYFTSTDKEVSSYVSSQLEGIKTNAFMAHGSFSIQQVIGLSADNITLFGEEYWQKILNILSHTKCYTTYSGGLRYACHIVYNVDDKSKKVIPDSGFVDHYKVPQTINELAPIFLAHEHIHALKETNYLEYQDGQRVGDVIPLFYELVDAKEGYADIYQIWLNARLFLLSDLKKQYDNVRLMMKNDFKNKDIYKVIAMRTGQYLNSFYYALLLYRMYLDDKDLIIGFVKKVLDHEMTTLELLNVLGIYGANNKKIFEEELNTLKKSL